MNDEYLRELERELTEATRVKRKQAFNVRYLADLDKKIKWLCNEIVEIEKQRTWDR